MHANCGTRATTASTVGDGMRRCTGGSTGVDDEGAEKVAPSPDVPLPLLLPAVANGPSKEGTSSLISTAATPAGRCSNGVRTAVVRLTTKAPRPVGCCDDDAAAPLLDAVVTPLLDAVTQTSPSAGSAFTPSTSVKGTTNASDRPLRRSNRRAYAAPDVTAVSSRAASTGQLWSNVVTVMFRP